MDALRDAGAAGVIAGQIIDARRQAARLRLQSPRHLGRPRVAARHSEAAGGGAGRQQIRAAAGRARRRAVHASGRQRAMAGACSTTREPQLGDKRCAGAVIEASRSCSPTSKKPGRAHEEPLERRRCRKAGRGLRARRASARELALRVYTTRLLGGEPRLVLHGGGNTSCKTRVDRPGRRRMGRALRQGQRLGHGRHRAAGPAGGEARRRCSRRASCKSCPTRTWWRCSAPT